ncbi:MAG: hypothetical protein MJB57_09670, partial [Gemmatimonadetes bacterium]|nr:hypothetical protein [Gemmatimonadota bacterium]
MPARSRSKRSTARPLLTLLLVLSAAIPISAAILGPPTVSISPSGGTYTSASRSVTIEWCDDVSLDAGSRQITVLHNGNTTDVTSSFSYQSPWTIFDCDVGARSVGTITLQNGLNTLTAKIRDNTGAQGTQSASYTYNAPEIRDVRVTPDGTNDSLEADGTTVYTKTFQVWNDGNQTSSFNIDEQCTGPVSACSAPSTVADIAPGTSKSVVLSFKVTDTAVGNAKIEASHTEDSSVDDTGHFRITGTPPLTVDPVAVSHTPDTDTVKVANLDVEVKWCDNSGLSTNPNDRAMYGYHGDNYGQIDYNNQIDYTIQYETTTPVLDCGVPGEFATVDATITLQPGVTEFHATHRDTEGNLGDSERLYFFQVDDLQVTPKNGSIVNRPPDTQALVDTFTVTNGGNVAGLFNLGVACADPVLNCQIGATQDSIDAGESIDVEVSYDTGEPGSETIQLTVTDAADPTVEATGVITVIVGSGGGINMTPNFDRSTCLTANAGGGAISQCGDLVITHPLPTTRTHNRVRAPGLIYNSWAAEPYPMVSAHVTLAQSAQQPDSMEVVLKLGTNEKERDRWDGAAWSPGDTRRITIGYSDPTLSTGVHEFILEVSPVHGTQVHAPILVDTIPLPVVNRRGSKYGRGWWIGGLEELFYQAADTSYFWVGGDGSTRWYRKTGIQDVWATAPFDRPDTLKLVGGELVRELRGGGQVVFNSSGKHVRTVTRLGHTTQFTHSGPRLTKISLPVAGSNPREYDFNYTSGKLSSVDAPPIGSTQRVTTINQVDAGISQITDPDGRSVTFNPSWGHLRIKHLEDRAGVRTTFTYHSNTRKLLDTRLHMVSNSSHSDDIVIRQINHEAQTWAPESRHPDSVYTFIDGPRSVADTVAFHIDYPTGAPRMIVNALGHTTVIERGLSGFPALVNRVVRPNGHVMTAAFNARGNVATVTDLSRNATTSYEYNDANWPDFVTKVIPPSVTDSVLMSYDGTTGNRLWQQDARGSTSRVQFRYYAGGAHDGMLRAIQAPMNSGAESDSLVYDNQYGNLSTQFGARTSRTDWIYDDVGRITTVQTEIDSLAV